MAYTKRYALGFNDSGPVGGTGVDSQFLNNVEAALLALLGVDATSDGQAPLWKAANSRYEPALIKNANVDPAAAISRSKLGALNIVDADIAGGANIAKSKLGALNIVDADVSAISIGKITGIPVYPGTELDYGEMTANASTSATTEGTAAPLVASGQKGAVTVTIASPAVFTLVAHGLAAGDAVTLYTTGSLPTGLTVGTVYYVIAAGLAADTFQLSTVANGAAIATSGAQSGTHTLAKAPVYDGSAVWIEFFFPALTATAATIVTFVIFRDTTVIGQVKTGPVNTVGNNQEPSVLMKVKDKAPPAGPHTYKIAAFVSANTLTVNVGTGGSGNLVPGYVRTVKV